MVNIDKFKCIAETKISLNKMYNINSVTRNSIFNKFLYSLNELVVDEANISAVQMINDNAIFTLNLNRDYRIEEIRDIIINKYIYFLENEIIPTLKKTPSPWGGNFINNINTLIRDNDIYSLISVQYFSSNIVRISL